MPYPRSLQPYTLPEFYAEFPREWMTRLRDVSPVQSGLDYLVPRYFAPRETWNFPDRGQWALYTAKPIAMVDADRAEQFRQHWSELAEGQQVGRKACVSDYQHFMWHAQGVYVKPFLILQGPGGGTPAKYTPSEQAFLQASHCVAEPLPLGTLPACGFDERVVRQITLRDRLLQQAGNSYEALEKLDSAAQQKRDDDAAERLRRETFLDTWRIIMEPSREFLKSYLKKSDATMALPDAPEGLGNVLDQWRDQYIEHGSLIGTRVANQRRLQVAVA